MRISGERSTQQPQPPNARHSHAAPDRQRREPPNPAHHHPRKTHAQHPEHGKPQCHSSLNKPHATGRRAGTKNAHTPNMGRARDIDEHNNSARTGAHATTSKATTRRDAPHKRARAAPPTNGRARPQMLYLHLAGQDGYIIAYRQQRAQPGAPRRQYATRGSLGDRSNHTTRHGDDSTIPRAHHNGLTVTVR